MYGTTRAKKYVKWFLGFTGSVRRSKLGLGIFDEDRETWYDRNRLNALVNSHLPDKFVSDFGDALGKIFRSNVWLILRNCKKALSMCSVDDLDPEVLERLEQRKDWNKLRYAVETVLD